MLPRFVGKKSVPRVLVAVRGHPVERDDALLGRRLRDQGETRHFVFELLPKIRYLGDRRVRIGERLLESLAGFVQRLELSPIHSGRRRLSERRGRRGGEQECARNDLHAGLLERPRDYRI
jgi:hypothetical protein